MRRFDYEWYKYVSSKARKREKKKAESQTDGHFENLPSILSEQKVRVKFVIKESVEKGKARSIAYLRASRCSARKIEFSRASLSLPKFFFFIATPRSIARLRYFFLIHVSSAISHQDKMLCAAPSNRLHGLYQAIKPIDCDEK